MRPKQRSRPYPIRSRIFESASMAVIPLIRREVMLMQGAHNPSRIEVSRTHEAVQNQGYAKSEQEHETEEESWPHHGGHKEPEPHAILLSSGLAG